MLKVSNQYEKFEYCDVNLLNINAKYFIRDKNVVQNMPNIVKNIFER
jgi:hypothetical protein